jgi:enoyl-CoA hydratase
MLHLTDDAGITTIRLDHGKAHALDLELTGALNTALTDLEQRDIRAVILTGTGSIFSAGVDLHRLLSAGDGYIRSFVPVMVDCFRRLFAFPRPVVAAVNGHAIAGGCILAAACDYRLMARGPATIGVPELRVGVPFPLVALEIVRFATSSSHLQELVYRGRTYGPDEAYQRGLVDELVASDKLREQAHAAAQGLATEPAARFRLTKRQLRAPTLASIDRHARETDADVLAEWTSPETLAAIRRYLDELKTKRRA